MNPKLTSALSYFSIIGWVIALILQKSNPHPFTNVHLKNSLGLHGIGFVLGCLTPMVAFSFLGVVMGLFLFILLILYVVGIIWSISGHDKPLPFVGAWFQKNIPDL